MITAEFNSDDEMHDVGVAGHLDVRRQLAGSLVVAFAIAGFCGLKVLSPPIMSPIRSQLTMLSSLLTILR